MQRQGEMSSGVVPSILEAARRARSPQGWRVTAVDAARLGTWDYHVPSGVVAWDKHTAALFGVALADFDGTIADFSRRVHPSDRAATASALQVSIDHGVAFDVQYRVVWPDGTVRHLLSRGTAARGAGGPVVRLLGACLDVTDLHSNALALEQALLEQAEVSSRLAGMAETALSLTSAETVDELVRIVLERGVSVLGADGGVVCVRDDERRVVRLTVSESLGPQTAVEYAELDFENPLPAVVSALTGETILLPDRASAARFEPHISPAYETTGRLAWAVLPLSTAGRLLGSLLVSWRQERTFGEAELDLLQGFAAQCALALDRIASLQAERRRAAADRGLSERLQRSLLTSPPQVPGLEVVVRYAPAAEGARVGGDWYDALVNADGALTLVIGDCAGHDQEAAAAMASVRNLLRATAYTVQSPPAAVLRTLEQTMAGLEVDALATAVLARVERLSASGARRLCWSNAGHPPPLLHRDGATRVLGTDADLLLGVVPGTDRHDHEVDLPPGSTVLLYTDGLVERRGEDLEVGIARLATLLDELAHLPLEQLCDGILERSLPADGAEDDVALLALRTEPTR
ncbi:MAG TPA: SpoIIE family protein phosphatase [Actinomycetales bacterium]